MSRDLRLSSMEEGTRLVQFGVTNRGAQDGGWTIYDKLRMATLSPFELFVYDEYWRLDTERPPSESGPKKIPRSKWDDRLRELELYDTPDGEAVEYLWSRLEDRHLEWWVGRMKEIREDKPQKSNEEEEDY